MATRQEVIFTGLTNSPSDYDCQDGELATCLNLINEDGALHPIHQPVVAEQNITLGEGDVIEFVHKVTHNAEIHSHYIIRKPNDTWYWIEKGEDGTKYTIDLNGFLVNAVSAVGNVICFVGDNKTVYAYWKNREYNIFDESLFKYDITITDQMSINTNSYYAASCNFTEDWDTIWKNNGHFSNTSGVAKSPSASQIVFSGIDALINKQIEEIDQYTFKYLSFGIVAIKLYDGTYRNISSPFILSPKFVSNKFIWRDSTKSIGTYFNAHKHKITVSMNIPDELKDLILGADIFLSTPETFLNTEETFHTIKNASNFIYDSKMAQDVYSFAMDFMPKKKIYKTIDNMSFYLSVSIDANEFGTPIQLKRITETNQSLSLSDFKKKTFGGKVAYTYNNRLHIGDVKSTIKNAFSTFVDEKFEIKTNIPDGKTDMYEMYLNNRLDLDGSKGMMCDAVIEVTISDNGTEKAVYEYTKLQYPLPPIIAYPDSNATKMTLYLHNIFDNSFFKKTMILHQSETMGMSYFVNLGGNRRTNPAIGNGSDWENNFGSRVDVINPNVSEQTDKTMILPDDENFPIFMSRYYYRLQDYTYTGGNFGDTGGTTNIVKKWSNERSLHTNVFEDSSESEFTENYNKVDKEYYTSSNHSLIKVSEAENPLVFPAKNSVQVGSSVISALAANTRPISEGQFGEAPLYAFTDEGVWVLMLGEEGTYVARQPANREICSNPNGILQIDDAVLYPTNRGIMMQQGRNSICITDQLDGCPFNFMDMKYANQIIATNKTESEEISYIRFRDYLKSADMIYDYYDNRIIVFNPNQAYAYVYSLKSKMWGTMKNVFNKRVNIYPESYATNKEGKVLNVYVEEPSSNTPYFLCSRPLTISDKEVYKTIFTCIARGYFRKETNGKCAMVLYGSNNLFDWYLIKTSINEYLRGMAGSPYKYFRVALIGNLATNESISGLSAEFQERLQNKLR
jgi:hypothetical protein